MCLCASTCLCVAREKDRERASEREGERGRKTATQALNKHLIHWGGEVEDKGREVKRERKSLLWGNRRQLRNCVNLFIFLIEQSFRNVTET